MATLNDYKLLNKVCANNFETAALANGFDNKIVESLPEKQKERFGFYYFIINQLTGINDYDEITELISDTDFNKTFYSNNDPDEGVDAIYIDEDNNVVHIFNFKYRENFNPDRKQGENEAILTFKFLSAIKGEASLPNKKLKELVDAIKERYESNDIWETIFHIVSNENYIICPKDPNIKNFAEIYDVKINPIGLNEITEFMSLRPSAVNAELMLNKESVMSFNSDDLSTNKSFVASISLPELIRITCNNEELRHKYNIEDENELHAFNINYNVLFDNVRGFVIRSKFNKNIESTIQSAPHNFFYFNNGITIVADNIISKEVNGNSKVKLKLENFQVLNGGQTLRTIHNYNASSSNNIDKLSKARVLVRFFNISDSELRREIGEYTNSQNSVDAISLASLRDEQIAIDKYLKENSVLFIRKKGNIGDLEDTTAFRTTITLERLGQLLLSTYGKPEEVSNKKKEIFGKYYEDLYKNNESLLTSSTIKLIDNFDTIKATYRSSKYEMTIQKIMYVVYISYKSDSCHFNEIIEKFESLLYGYKTKNQIGSAMSRILITNSFKKYIDNEFDIS